MRIYIQHDGAGDWLTPFQVKLLIKKLYSENREKQEALEKIEKLCINEEENTDVLFIIYEIMEKAQAVLKKAQGESNERI
jgi:hypothetical protein